LIGVGRAFAAAVRCLYPQKAVLQQNYVFDKGGWGRGRLSVEAAGGGGDALLQWAARRAALQQTGGRFGPGTVRMGTADGGCMSVG